MFCFISFESVKCAVYTEWWEPPYNMLLKAMPWVLSNDMHEMAHVAPLPACENVALFSFFFFFIFSLFLSSVQLFLCRSLLIFYPWLLLPSQSSYKNPKSPPKLGQKQWFLVIQWLSCQGVYVKKKVLAVIIKKKTNRWPENTQKFVIFLRKKLWIC